MNQFSNGTCEIDVEICTMTDMINIGFSQTIGSDSILRSFNTYMISNVVIVASTYFELHSPDFRTNIDVDVIQTLTYKYNLFL